ncbi:MAG: hypothetical protein QNJ38_23545 [Prochloraceae cyanobacterium]|nr:hypothetical protein [Prochloraceae cyanobacterium]
MNNPNNEPFDQSSIEIEIDSEFQSLITPLTDDEFSFLEADLKEHGCIDPLIIWQETNILLDGHNRYSICTKHKIEYQIKYLCFSDRELAKQWMIRHQLGRRNLSNNAISYYRGALYNSQKQQGKRTDLTLGQNELKLDTATELANEYAVGASTIKRDGEYANAIDTLSDTIETPDLKPKLLTRKIRLTKDSTKKLAEVATDDPVIVKLAYQSAKNGKDWYRQVTEELSKKTGEAFPYQVGEVVLVQAKDNQELRRYTGYWGIVTKVYDLSCDLDVYDSKLQFIKAEYLMDLNCLPEHTQQAQAIMNRLQKLAKIEIVHPMINDIRRGIGSRRNFTLSAIEEKIFNLIEDELNVDRDG